MSTVEGIYLPLITPFLDGEVDYPSLKRLVAHYRNEPLDGLVLLGSTGESAVLSRAEKVRVVQTVIDENHDQLPVYVGLGGNNTASVVDAVDDFDELEIDGFMSVVPYYNKPSVDGIIQHFRAIADNTVRPIIIYNVPSRTGANLPNDAVLELAATVSNVDAVKDACGDIRQSLDLLERAPEEFGVLCGDDELFFTSLVNGGNGGILASSHLATATFAAVREAVQQERLVAARELWRGVSPMIPLLFAESNPMPIKHCLWRKGLIDSAECRLPLTKVSMRLADELDVMLGKLATA